MGDIWRAKEKAWNKEQADFGRGYAAPFPESIGAKRNKDDSFTRSEHLRRFVAVGVHPATLAPVPLMAFLVRIITPEEYSSPCMLLHWINCITFHNSPKQIRMGILPQDAWKDPQYLLFRRMGPPQDHALLLCSVLLGRKKDAYIVKGTIWVRDDSPAEEVTEGIVRKEKPAKLVEHVWVMTREEGNFVTFWEPCSREMYHLPARWNPKKRKRKAKDKKKKKDE